MVEQGALVELEVGRADDGDGVDARLGRVGGERDRIDRRLGAAVRRNLQPASGRLEEELECTLPLVDPEEQPFAGRPEGEQPVDASGGEEVDVGSECALVQPVAVERRHGRGQGTTQHEATLRVLDAE